jgi:hypothetical protein
MGGLLKGRQMKSMQEIGGEASPRMKLDSGRPVPNQNEGSGRLILGERLVPEQLEEYWFSGRGNLLIQCDFCL